MTMYPFQKLLLSEIEEAVSNPCATSKRDLNWTWCPGGCGKSTIVDRAKATWPDDVVVITKLMESKDIAEYMRQHQFVKVILVDLTKCNNFDNCKRYMGDYESLKNRILSASKYASGELKLVYYPYIHFFANLRAKEGWWTWDRYKQRKLIKPEHFDGMNVIIETDPIKWTDPTNCPDGYIIQNNGNDN